MDEEEEELDDEENEEEEDYEEDYVEGREINMDDEGVTQEGRGLYS